MSVEHPAKTVITVNLALAAAVYTTVTALFVYVIDHFYVLLDMVDGSFEPKEQSFKLLLAIATCAFFLWYLIRLVQDIHSAKKSLWSYFNNNKLQSSTEEAVGSSLRIDNNIKIEQNVTVEHDKVVTKTVITTQKDVSDNDD